METTLVEDFNFLLNIENSKNSGDYYSNLKQLAVKYETNYSDPENEAKIQEDIGFSILLNISKSIQNPNFVKAMKNIPDKSELEESYLQKILNCRNSQLINYSLQILNMFIHVKIIDQNSEILQIFWGLNKNFTPEKNEFPAQIITKHLGLDFTKDLPTFSDKINESASLRKHFRQMLIFTQNCASIGLFETQKISEQLNSFFSHLISIFFFLDGSKNEIDERCCEFVILLCNFFSSNWISSFIRSVFEVLDQSSKQSLKNLFEFLMHCLDFRIETRNSYLLVEDMEPLLLTKDEQFSQQQSKTEVKNGIFHMKTRTVFNPQQ